MAKYMGDGVFIYFGYPEDDAERAVRAGLELIAAVTARQFPCKPALVSPLDLSSSAT